MVPLKKTDDTVIDGKVLAVLAYLSILCIIPLVWKKDNAFALYHGKQGLVLFVGQVAVFVASIIFPILFKVGMFIIGVLSLYGIVAVLEGRKCTFPVVSDIAAKITL